MKTLTARPNKPFRINSTALISKAVPRASTWVRGAVVLLCLAVATGAQAATITKAATGTDLYQGASWVGNTAPGSGDIATWAGTSLGLGLTITTANQSWGGISVTGASTDIAITSGYQITLGASGIDMSASTNNLLLGTIIALGANQTWTVNSPVALTIQQSSYSGLINGSGTLTLSGTATNFLWSNHNGIDPYGGTGGNTYSGGTVFSGGTTLVATNALTASNGDNDFINPLGTGPITFVSGTLQSYGGNYYPNTFMNNVVVATGNTGSINTGNRFVLGPQSGTTTNTLTGGGTLNVIGLNDARVEWSIKAAAFTGTINFSTASGPSVSGNGIGFHFTGAGTRGPVSGGSFDGFGSATVNFVGSLATVLTPIVPSGTTTFNIGALNDTTGLANILDVGQGGSVTYSIGGLNANCSYGGTIIGSTTALTKVGTGKLKLSGANTYGGVTTISAGTLQLGVANAIPAKAVTINGALDLNGYSVSVGDLTGSGTVDSTTAGTPVLTVTSSSSGSTFTGLIQNTAGTLSLTKAGSGTLTLAPASGNNSYGGATAVNAGKLVVNSSQTGTGNFSVADGADLNVVVSGASQLQPSSFTLGSSSGVTLEFNGVSSTTVAPIKATTFSSGGTLAIKVNSGAFTAGQSYPLIAWTSGSAPTTSLSSMLALGVVSHLTVSGNTLKLVVDSVSDIWTGVASGFWDTTTSGNWTGHTSIFANGDAALFDDTAPGTTSVTVNALVQPGSFIVNNSSKTYSIASSAGKYIGGSSSLTKNGSGTLTLSGGVNNYSGGTIINAGTVSVGALANGGSASDLGASANSAANLSLNGGTLQYTGAAAASDRLFTVSTNGASLDASGTGALNLNNTAALGLSGSGARTLTLTGTNTAGNRLVAVVADNGGATSLAKSGTGSWTLSGANTYSGGTTVAAGTLALGAANVIPSGPGVGDVSVSGTLDLAGFNLALNGLNGGGAVDDVSAGGTPAITVGNNDVSSTFSGAIKNTTGTLALNKTGAGTLTLSGTSSSYSGGTTVSSGTLTVAGANALGAAAVNVTSGGVLRFDASASFTQSNNIVGTGPVVKTNANSLLLAGTNTFTGGLTINMGAVYAANNRALGTGLVVIDNQWAGATNYSQLYLANGVNVTNAITIVQGASPYVGLLMVDPGVDGFASDTDTNGATYSGPITFAPGSTQRGGHFCGPQSGTNWLVISGPVTNNASTNTVTTRNGQVRFSGGGDYPGFIIGQGIVSIGANNGLCTNASLIMNRSGASAFDLNGFSQTLAGLTNFTPGAMCFLTNSSPSPGTLTLNLPDLSLNSFSGVLAGNLSLVQNGNASLTLTNINTYTGNTIINAGQLSLAGNGSINQSALIDVVSGAILDLSGSTVGMSIRSGQTLKGSGSVFGSLPVAGTVSPGDGIGTLTINGDLTMSNSAVTLAEVDNSGPINDLLSVSGTLTYGGTLLVTNISGTAYTTNQVITLFSSGAYSGTFNNILFPQVASYDASQLAVNGTITVLSLGPSVSTTPTNISYAATGTNLQLSWPSDHIGWRLLAQTNNLAHGISTNRSDWGMVPGSQATNQVTVPIAHGLPCEFYRLVYP